MGAARRRPGRPGGELAREATHRAPGSKSERRERIRRPFAVVGLLADLIPSAYLGAAQPFELGVRLPRSVRPRIAAVESSQRRAVESLENPQAV